jgi:hypothetical protein
MSKHWQELESAYRKTSYWLLEGLVESDRVMVLRVDEPCSGGFFQTGWWQALGIADIL